MPQHVQLNLVSIAVFLHNNIFILNTLPQSDLKYSDPWQCDLKYSRIHDSVTSSTLIHDSVTSNTLGSMTVWPHTRVNIGTIATSFWLLILARLLYAAPALRGYLSSTDINCLQQFLDKAKRWNITLVITALINCLINVTLLCLNHR